MHPLEDLLLVAMVLPMPQHAMPIDPEFLAIATRLSPRARRFSKASRRSGSVARNAHILQVPAGTPRLRPTPANATSQKDRRGATDGEPVPRRCAGAVARAPRSAADHRTSTASVGIQHFLRTEQRYPIITHPHSARARFTTYICDMIWYSLRNRAKRADEGECFCMSTAEANQLPTARVDRDFWERRIRR
jgi:hypothetical protein